MPTNFSLVLISQTASTSAYALNRKQLCEQLHEDMDSFSEIADINIIEHSVFDANIKRNNVTVVVIPMTGSHWMTKMIAKIQFSGI